MTPPELNTLSLAEPAPAKINLHLHLLGRRADGYHLLDSLAAFAGAGAPGGADWLRWKPGGAFSLRVEGPEAAALADEPDNLVLRAGRLLAVEAGIAPHGQVVLEKFLPVASGIGGGSADAAAALRLLNRVWEAGLGHARLSSLAEQLGADVPVCLDSRPARMGGIGAVLTPAPTLPLAGLLLANPRIPLSTPAVFRARSGDFSSFAQMPTAWADAGAMAAGLAACRNDLEPAAMSLCPEVAGLLDAIRALPGCLLARMSGSGASCFGLFATPEAAHAVAPMLPEGCWRWGGGFTTGASALYSPTDGPA
ncbi:4-(cytidine 5'-diphospho)-2-C-methyl-D-erythritol kinase [Roseomonas sp. 18066]|uniref:4-(cytidine 5'-diphospho)-2-C-methyl-D-erythritol kinase n=1 Tax=Roseomonas sp. 18066 TaxID=2681412 RepID=UPI001F237C5E|nr:4-(cytidine 5'-diphospho)-2-C-methyl-D-erythritol kinase [Roseomonas sp. 18066]